MMCYRFSCTLRPGPFPTPLSLVESALPDTLRVLTAINRNRPPATPLQSALTELAFVTPPESALPKKREGRSVPESRALLQSRFQEGQSNQPHQPDMSRNDRGGVSPS